MAIDYFIGEHWFLSNFYPAETIYEARRYPTSEHAYQAAKSLEPHVQRAIALLRTPQEAKRYGRQIALRAGWESMKVDVMREVLRRKFSDPALAQRLLTTGDEPLVEGNTWNDTFWGVCRGRGQNWLGKLLMELRDELRGSNQ